MELYRLITERLKKNQNTVVINKLKKEGIGTIQSLDKQIIETEINQPELLEQEEYNLFLEPFFPMERMIVLGGGHIALPLSEFASRVGFAVTVVDDRPSFANTYRFPKAQKVLCQSFDACFLELNVTVHDYIVIITRGHRHDLDCLRQIMNMEEPVYVGMIGSKRRVAAVKEQLLLEGYDGERLNRICSPIGLSIGAVTPEEISISIMAQVIKRKRLDQGAIASNHTDLDNEVIEELSNGVKMPLSIVTILSSKGSVPRCAGAKMLVYETGQIKGSIGGGCSEAAVIQDALKIIGTKTYLVKTIDMTGEAAEEEGMVCGGTMQVLIEDYGYDSLQ